MTVSDMGLFVYVFWKISNVSMLAKAVRVQIRSRRHVPQFACNWLSISNPWTGWTPDKKGNDPMLICYFIIRCCCYFFRVVYFLCFCRGSAGIILLDFTFWKLTSFRNYWGGFRECQVLSVRWWWFFEDNSKMSAHRMTGVRILFVWCKILRRMSLNTTGYD